MKHILTVILVWGWLAGNAQQPKVYTTDDGAIQGYDPVAYFTEGKPVKGSKDFSYQWKEATWYFASENNLKAFKESPESYVPQYGGYCAYGTSRGYKAPTQPDAWTVFNNKLYLNYNKDVVKTWSEKKETFIIKADENWKKIEIE